MNRNVESHFSMIPQADISRSRFDRSFDHKTTFNVGELIPFFVDLTVMPGDTFDIETSKVVRLQTLLTPVMDNIYLDTYWFFIPYRLVWQHWRELMGENRSSAWLPDVEYSVPQINAYMKAPVDSINNGIVHTGDIFDYMGIPTGVVKAGVSSDSYKFSFSALPYRALCMTFNEWFRDENLTDPINWSDGDADVNLSDLQYPGADSDDLSLPFKVAKYHDYFTSCLPSAQKGPPVSVPAGFNVDIGSGWPVIPGSAAISQTGTVYPVAFKDFSGTNAGFLKIGLGSTPDWPANTFNNNLFSGINVDTDGQSKRIYPSNLYAAPASNQMTGLSVLVNDLRYAFQLQKLYERDARGGESLASSFKKIAEKIWKAA